MHANERFWNKLAEGYSRKPVADPDAYQAKLEATKARLRPGDKLLDVGCGTGSLALELAPHVAQVHAIDLSSEMIRIANGKAADAGVGNVTFHTGSAAELSALGETSFDVVCAYNILHLVDDRGATLAQIFELLEPGGHFISTTPCLGESYVPYRPVLALMRLVGKAPPVDVIRVGQLRADLERAGFVEITRQEVSDSKTTAFVLAQKPAAST